ncbi:hypothetical protein B484DRAFT_433492, partial [Ochromonadaceae sp. CCMP2298]
MSLKINKTAKFAVLDPKSVDQPVFKAKTVTPEVAEEDLYVSPLSVEEKVAIAMSVGEETLTVDELRALYTARAHPIVYDGFEPSGRMHIAQGVLRAINVNKLTSTGCMFKFWVADWEYASAKKKKFKPVIISHHMLMGLKEGQEKMSKSDPDSAIFMEDSAEDVK